MRFSMIARISTILILAAIFSSCSGAKSPVEPKNPTSPGISDSIGIADSNEVSNRTVLAVYDAVIDPVAKTFTVTPAERTADFHFPLTQLYPNVLKITGYGWTPNFWADIKLTHPFPGSGIDAFDPRVIAILPARTGVSFNYPVFNCIGNNSVVVGMDAYTKLFDNLGGSIPGNTNPFKAYFKSQPNRRWTSTGVTSETQRWNLKLAGFSGSIQFKLVVDVSTNYPNPPQPVVDNAPEPVNISASVSDGLDQEGGSALVKVTFLDWQGANQIKCKVEAPNLFSGSVQLTYSYPGANPDEYVFEGTITNSLLATPGIYNILIAAWDIPTDVHIFSELEAYVSGIPNNPVDATPPWLNFSPKDVDIVGNYLYVAGYVNGLHIFDISNPTNPVWVNSVNTLAAYRVCVTNGYAYVADVTSLQIIDIDPPNSANIVKTISLPLSEGVYDVAVTNGYAYVADGANGLQIIDIDPPSSAYILKNVGIIGETHGVCISNEYAYVTDDSAGLQIIDVEPPDQAQIVKTVSLPGEPWGVYISNGYAYISNMIDSSGMQIVDIEPLNSAYLVKTVATPTGSWAWGIYVSGEYAYMANFFSGMQIIDIDPPESAYIVKTVDTPGQSEGVWVAGKYSYLADYRVGLQVIDIESPESAYIVKTVDTPCAAHGVYVLNENAYVMNSVYDYSASFQIINLETPNSVYVNIPLGNYGIKAIIEVSGGYAYMQFQGQPDLEIYDVEPPDSVHIIKSVDTPGNVTDIYVSDKYAYVGDGSLEIIDIDPPESAYIMKTIDTPGTVSGVFISNGYAYVADDTSGLTIIDVDPPESAYIVKTVDSVASGGDIYVSDGYAFITRGSSGMQIFDIDPPNSAYYVKIVNTPGTAERVSISGGYAYVTDGLYGLQIIDIYPPESAYIIKSLDTPGYADDVFITNGYCYIADRNSGLRRIKLW